MSLNMTSRSKEIKSYVIMSNSISHFHNYKNQMLTVNFVSERKWNAQAHTISSSVSSVKTNKRLQSKIKLYLWVHFGVKLCMNLTCKRGVTCHTIEPLTCLLFHKVFLLTIILKWCHSYWHCYVLRLLKTYLYSFNWR